MEFLGKWLKSRRGAVGGFLFVFAVYLSVFALCGLSVAQVYYPTLICLAAGALWLVLDFLRAGKKHRALVRMREQRADEIGEFPEGDTLEDQDYQALIQGLCAAQRAMAEELEGRYEDRNDYYATWAHQIKTPIASMRLLLGLLDQNPEVREKLSGELMRVEQYVEMALCYLRLDAASTDYVIRECSLDAVAGQALKKFAGQFYYRKLSLSYEPGGIRVLTDEKWLSFVVEQVISNALKYTFQGGITISVQEPETLCIRDTGIGIAPEDLPRIFEKGYTGVNGRRDKRASGLGLYLCRRICGALGHRIEVSSAPGEGTCVRIFLERAGLEVE